LERSSVLAIESWVPGQEITNLLLVNNIIIIILLYMKTKNIAETAISRPLQARSLATEVAILDAVETLLQEKSFHQITTAEIAGAAGLTTGAIYGRFKSKEDLLPHLHLRFLDWINKSVPKWFSKVDWASLDLSAACDEISEITIRLHKRKPWMIRTVTLYLRGQQRSDLEGQVGHSDLVQTIFNSLRQCRGGESLSEASMVFAIHSALTIAREVIVYADAPMARAVGRDEKSLAERISRLIKASLLTENLD